MICYLFCILIEVYRTQRTGTMNREAKDYLAKADESCEKTKSLDRKRNSSALIFIKFCPSHLSTESLSYLVRYNISLSQNLLIYD